MTGAGDLLPSPPMGKGKGTGPGRPRSVAAADDEGRSSNAVVRLADRHRAALDEAVAAAVAANRSAVIRELVEAWAGDDRVRRAVASWRSRAKGGA